LNPGGRSLACAGATSATTRSESACRTRRARRATFIRWLNRNQRPKNTLSLTEKVSARLKAQALAGSTVTLKLKSADFKLRTRAQALSAPTQLAARIFAAGRELLRRDVGSTQFRHIGIGVRNLEEAHDDDFADLLDRRGAQAEHAVDRLRDRFGRDAMVKGLALEDE